MKSCKKHFISTFCVLLSCVLLCSCSIIPSNPFSSLGSGKLKKEIKREWSITEFSDDLYYDLVLEFKEDTIEYRFENDYYSSLNETISTYDYRVISSDTIEYATQGSNNYKKVKVKIKDDTLNLDPGIAGHNLWFDH